MKTCSKCKIEKPFEAFHKNKGSTDGYSSYCIDCYKSRRLELKKNPLMQLERQIKSSVILENKLLKRENKRLCNGCKEIFLIDDLLSGVICKECSIKRDKEYHEKNKEKRNECSKKYHEKNKEKMREYQIEYREKNLEKIREHKREYYKKKKLEMQTNT